jgi:hypothetical protein
MKLREKWEIRIFPSFLFFGALEQIEFLSLEKEENKFYNVSQDGSGLAFILFR